MLYDDKHNFSRDCRTTFIFHKILENKILPVLQFKVIGITWFFVVSLVKRFNETFWF